MNNENRIFKPDGFDVCKNNIIPPQNQDSNFKTLLAAVIINTPIPALERGLGELPRFTAEVGTFVGFSPSIRGYLINGGFGQGQETTGAVGGIEVAARFGVGLDGVLNESGDGLLFLAAGWRQDGSSTTGIVDVPGIESYGNLLAAIPGRSAFNVRLRFPFYLLPGDLLILGPMLFFIDEEALVNVGVSAVNGGLIPWQAGVETSFGRFQIVLGREISVYLFGRTKERDALFNISKDENGAEQLYVLSYRSTQFEFPFLEYRPITSFEVAQRSSLLIQFYGGFDVPNNVEVLEGPIEEGSTPELKTVWYLGARLIFDWRHYF